MTSLPPRSRTPELWPHLTRPPRILASTGATFWYPTSTLPGAGSNHFRSLLFTPDGTTLLTTSADAKTRTYILPPTLLSSPRPQLLEAYNTTKLPSLCYSTAIYPLANLADPGTFLYLTSCAASPIRLQSLLSNDLITAYPLIDPETESFLPAYSLTFRPYSPTTFLSGTTNRIALWDLNSSSPITVFKTIPTRRTPQTTETMRGIVSALGVSPEVGVLAAGTFSRQVGLYSDDGAGDVVGVFELEAELPKDHGGNGVTQLIWSKCGRYLYVVERCSDTVECFDIRVTGKRVGALTRRRADRNQRLEVALGVDGEIVGGGEDGIVRVWEAPGIRAEGDGNGEMGERSPVMEWRASKEPVGGCAVHPMGAVVATVSGERKMSGEVERDGGSGEDSEEEEEEEEEGWDNTLRVWEIPPKPVVGELMPDEPRRERELGEEGENENET